ncbi:MAG TPA: sensor domain-containing diguanylate cyclase [Pyrinomonadaceae bacterium]|jgi:diguanylate cyclase (GGDEF)-like protein|nr:sensor domain-containing diguanylate cyclase [Pyrinomonadaceae bacterium]
MSKVPDNLDTAGLLSIAEETGVAIAVCDGPHELYAANNNSICRTLNPDGEFIGPCKAFCGTALEEVLEVGSRVSYTCHAGLECRALPMKSEDQPLVAIVGRTFLKAENYRRASERALSGDWKVHPPTRFFENVLITGAEETLDNATGRVENVVGGAALQKPIQEQEQPEIPVPSKQKITAQKNAPSGRAVEARAWRSFFGSLLKTDYGKAADSILEFIAQQYGLSALIWLDRRGTAFETTASYGELKGRGVRLRISPEDPRLLDALQNDNPLRLGEKSREGVAPNRTLSLFPIAVSADITAAIAVLDQSQSDEVDQHLVRLCHSLAPQLEILRLRSEVARRESLAAAVRGFSRSMRKIDADDLWLNLTQHAAQMLDAERASLLVYDEREDRLEIKAMIGSRHKVPDDADTGRRVSQVVFYKGEPAVITDVTRTGLPPAAEDRGYKTVSFLSSPISIAGRTIGVMNFTDRAGGRIFDKATLDLFLAIAPQLAVAIDRALLKEKAGEFEQLSVTDSLTGLLNRRYIEARLTEEIKRSTRHGFPMGFMMLDVDQFKSYNDSFGHPAGDEALKLVGHVIRETLRGADVAARFGGEEFAILLPQTTGEEAVAIAERIRHNIETADFAHRQVTASIGVASCSADLCVSADLVAAADRALYEAKRRGRNRVLEFEDLTH